MTMYDGASNSNTAFATVVATSNTTPSPQVCSSSAENGTYPAWRAFDQSVFSGTSWYNSGLPNSLMVDLGSGNTKLINKYAIAKSDFGVNYNPKDWVLQGTNNVAATAGDAKNANGWTDLDTRTNAVSSLWSGSEGAYLTFSNDTFYRYYRLYITAADGTQDGVSVFELKLVSQLGVYDGANNSSTSYATAQATSDTDPSPQVCSATYEDATNKAWKIFDRDLGTYWAAQVAVPNALMVVFGGGVSKLINKYSLKHLSDGYSTPYSWELQGSNDVTAAVTDAEHSTKWVTLDSRVHVLTYSESTYFTFVSGTAYQSFRLYISEVTGGGGFSSALYELKLVEQFQGTIGLLESVSSSDATNTALSSSLAESQSSVDISTGEITRQSGTLAEVISSTYVANSVLDYRERSIAELITSSDALNIYIAGQFDVHVAESINSYDIITSANEYLQGTLSEDVTSSDISGGHLPGEIISGSLNCTTEMSIFDITALEEDFCRLNASIGPATCSIVAIQDIAGNANLVSVASEFAGIGAVGCVGEVLVSTEASQMQSTGAVGVNGVISLGGFYNDVIFEGITENLGVINTSFGINYSSIKGIVDSVGVINLFGEVDNILLLGNSEITGVLACLAVEDGFSSAGVVGSTGNLNLIEVPLKFSSSGTSSNSSYFIAYCLNLFKKGLVSTFTNYGFNSFAEINGVLLGAKSGGMYSLIGDLDDTASINSRLIWPLEKLGTTNVKQVRAVKYLGRLDDSVNVNVTDGSASLWTATLVNNNDDMNAVEVPGYFPLTARGRYLQFQMSNINGCDFLLDRLEAALYVLGRM